MRILWFTNTPSRYADFGGYNGGGWISSLEEELSKHEDVELGVAFFMNGQPSKVQRRNVTYYPMENPFSDSLLKKIEGTIASRKHKETIWLKGFLRVIEDYKPDIVEVFGSEQSFGQIAPHVKIPLILYIQGILTPYYNAFLPPFVSEHNYIWQDFSLLHALKRHKDIINFKKDSLREVGMLKTINYFIGRTEWDKRITSIYAPNAKYYYGSEILRDVFYEPTERELPVKTKIVSTLSSPLYKGYETVLKTANILTNQLNLDFEWLIYGNIDPRFGERRTGIRHEDVNVRFMGVAAAAQLKKTISEATMYVHPSYIDNSPNSVCEAQILGIPVVATNVGGIPSLIENEETGFLVPANDPFQMAYIINMLASDKKLNIRIGENARNVAMKRHDKRNVVTTLLETYKTIIHDSEDNQ